MRKFFLCIFPVLPLGAWAQQATAQAFVVEPSTIPGITIAGRGTAQFPPNASSILGNARNSATDSWLPFGMTLSNNSVQGIIAIAARWVVTSADGNKSETVLTRSMIDAKGTVVPPDSEVLLLPDGVLGQQPGLRTSLQPTAYQPNELSSFQNAKGIQVFLDGIVFASGQFLGPDSAREFEGFKADSTARYNVASKILSQHNAGVPGSGIVQWLQQTATAQRAAANQSGSVLGRDWVAGKTAAAADFFLRVDRARGDAELISMATQAVQSPPVTVYR